MGKLKPYRKIYGKWFGIHFTSKGPELIELNNDREALPIITDYHSPRCPYCSSKKCIHALADIIPMIVEKEDDIAILVVRRCINTNKLFITDSSRKPQPIKLTGFSRKPQPIKLICRRCTSTNLITTEKVQVKRKSKNIDNNYIKLYGDVERRIITFYRCKQCNLSAYLSESVGNNEAPLSRYFYSGLEGENNWEDNRWPLDAFFYDLEKVL